MRAITKPSRRIPVQAILVIVVLALSLTWTLGFSRNNARHTALHEGGMDTVTSIDYKFLSLCHRDAIAYRVRGTRDGYPVSFTVCAAFPQAFSYIR